MSITNAHRDAKPTPGERELNRWNAFLHMKRKERAEANPDAPGLRVSQLSASVREEWKSMSPDERVAATEDAMKELQGVRDTKKQSPQNVPSTLSVLHDVRKTLRRIEDEVDALYSRTGTELMVLSVKSNFDHHHRPYVHTTSGRIDDFFELRCGLPLSQFTKALEHYCLCGLQPTASTSEELAKVKSQASEIILEALQEAVHPAVVTKMVYKDFPERIIDRYGVIVENWPLKEFTSPSAFSRSELSTLIRAFQTGSTTFRRLSPEELQAWRIEQYPALYGHEYMPNPSVGAAAASLGAPMAVVVDAEAATANTVALPSQRVHPVPDVSPASPNLSPAHDTSKTESAGQDASQRTAANSTTLAILSPVDPALTVPLVSSPSPESTSTASPTHSETIRQPPSTSTSNLSTFKFVVSSSIPTSTFIDGSPLIMPARKPRKKRSDAGVKRGPRTRTVVSENPEGHDVAVPGSR